MQWSDVLADPHLRDLPDKSELNEYGQIVRVPRRPSHSLLQYAIARLLERCLPDGKVAPELAIRTRGGTKVAAVARSFGQRSALIYGDDPAEAPVAPEICVEVLSRGNTGAEMDLKRRLYFEAGAQEVWLCTADGGLRFFAAEGEMTHSGLAPGFPTRVEV